MGCQISKLFNSLRSHHNLAEDGEEETPKVYSWERRENINVKDFTIDGIKDDTVGRVPGSVNGQQFIIQNCENCDIYVFDHCAAVTVDDCNNCRIFIGAIKTSIFIRDCNNCTIATTCQQFRTRDCKRLDVLLCCVTQPIIESTTGVKFGCFQFNYPQFKSHMKAAGLSAYSNNWNNIHDFTPVPGENNYSFILRTDPITKYLPIPTKDPFKSIPITVDPEESLIPYTLGNKLRPEGPGCLIAFFYSSFQTAQAEHLLRILKGITAVQTVEIKLSTDQAKKIFNTEAYNNQVNAGPVILMELLTDDIKSCRDAALHVAENQAEKVHVSSTFDAAAQEIECLNNLVEMQMAV